jgi:2-polyprenyl-3-methyl-5-hydroxy-6-metoxy-1,4-benzoquinol methylase
MKKQICPYCQSDNTEFYLSSSPFRINRNIGKFNFYHCENCGIIFLDVQALIDLPITLYDKNYHCFKKYRKRSILDILIKYGLKKRVKLVIKNKKSGRLLDIGCASGEFLAEFLELEKEGWELYGVEPNHNARDYAKSKGINNLFSDLSEANFKDHFFDVITLWDVIEHINTPNNLFFELNRIIKINGVLVIKTPNPYSMEAKIFKEYWSGLEVPWHSFLFPKKFLETILTNHGFTNMKYHKTTQDYYTFYRSIINYLTSAKYNNLKNTLEFIFFKYPFKIVFIVILNFLRLLGIDSAITITAVRKK